MGPCLCGDPYCASCGNPSAAILEAAEAGLMDALAKESLTAEEYGIVLRAGLAAVTEARQSAARASSLGEPGTGGER